MSSTQRGELDLYVGIISFDYQNVGEVSSTSVGEVCYGYQDRYLFRDDSVVFMATDSSKTISSKEGIERYSDLVCGYGQRYCAHEQTSKLCTDLPVNAAKSKIVDNRGMVS